MSETKFTKGPWHGSGCAVCVEGMDVARIYQTKGVSNAEFAANRSLVAAAPELYDGCALFVTACQQAFGIKLEHNDDWIYDAMPSSGLAGAYFTARAALAKATAP